MHFFGKRWIVPCTNSTLQHVCYLKMLKTSTYFYKGFCKEIQTCFEIGEVFSWKMCSVVFTFSMTTMEGISAISKVSRLVLAWPRSCSFFAKDKKKQRNSENFKSSDLPHNLTK